MCPRRFFAFFVFFLFCPALKASPLVQLELEAPSQCPNKTSIEQTVARLVQRPPAVPLPVSARLAPDGERWVLVATLEGGQRVIGGDSCVAAAEALVVLMALAIDPASPMDPAALQDFEHANAGNAQLTQPPAAPVTPVAAPVTPVAAPVTPVAAPVQPAPMAVAPSKSDWRLVEAQAQGRAGDSQTPVHLREPDRLGISLSLLGEWGALPKPSLGPALFFRYGSTLRWGELSVFGLYPQNKYENGSNTKGARFEVAAFQVGGCAAPEYNWPVAACFGAELGDYVGQGVNTDADVTRHTVWAALTAGLAYRVALGGGLALELRLGAAFPLRQREFGVLGPSELRFTPGPVSGRGLIGVSWR